MYVALTQHQMPLTNSSIAADHSGSQLQRIHCRCHTAIEFFATYIFKKKKEKKRKIRYPSRLRHQHTPVSRVLDRKLE